MTYNFYHVEQHGRPHLEDPWSIRQTAAYQAFSFQNKTSAWIMVQLAEPLRNIIEQGLIENEASGRLIHGHWLQPIVIHALILTSSQRQWRRYIKYLAESLSNLVGHRTISLHPCICSNREQFS